MADFLAHIQTSCVSVDTTIACRLQKDIGLSAENVSLTSCYDPQLVEEAHRQAVESGVMAISTNTLDLLSCIQEASSDLAIENIHTLCNQAFAIAQRTQPHHLLFHLALPFTLTQVGCDALARWAENLPVQRVDAIMFSQVLDGEVLKTAIDVVQDHTDVPIVLVLQSADFGWCKDRPHDVQRIKDALVHAAEAGIDLGLIELSATPAVMASLMRELQALSPVKLGVIWNPLPGTTLHEVVDAALEMASLPLACMGLGMQATQAQVSACAHALRYLTSPHD